MSGKVGVLVLRARKPSPWRSMNEIADGLTGCYRRLPKTRFDVRTIAVPNVPKAEFYEKLRRILARRRRWKIAMVDHHLPHLSLVALPFVTKAELEIYLHVYGDVISRAPVWLSVARALEGQRVRFLCGSERQTRLMSTLFGSDSCARVPFPVDDFYFRRASTPTRTRRVVYVGRLSAQKNVESLVDLVNSSVKAPGLDLAGWYSNDANHFLNPDPSAARMRSRLRSKIDSDRVCHLGTLERRALRMRMSRASAVVTLSTYLLEEFGMGLAQALACGTPVILTDWGGHGEFADLPFVTSVPVRIVGGIPRPDLEAARRSLENLRLPKSHERKRIARATKAKFGREAVTRSIQKQLSKLPSSYGGPTPRFETLARTLIATKGRLYSKKKSEARRLLETYLEE